MMMETLTMINPMDLSGKYYLVTGASSGLGRQVCVTLSCLGAKVILIARRAEMLQETVSLMEGSGHICYPFDLNKVEEIEDLIKRIVVENGRLDGVAYCAGMGPSRPLALTTYEFMQEIMRVNVEAFIELVRVVTKRKNCNDNASIVAISSTSSIRGDKGKIAYSTTKGALDSAVLSMAMELGETKKIRVNTVNPAWMKTDMYYKYIETCGKEKIEDIEQRQFLGVAEAKEVAGVVAFLLSSAASQITGQSIIVDGGCTIY